MDSPTSVPVIPGLLEQIEQQVTAAVALRHDLHRNPCLSGHEEPTADQLMSFIGVDDYQVVAGTGRLVRIGPKEGPCVGIRAELDALPIQEKTGVSFTSTTENMHACGHDVHMAGAAALAKAAMNIELPVALLFIFQPREETYPSGAQDIMESGVLDAHDMKAVLGVHVHPAVPAGSITTGSGVVNAAADEFRIVVNGVGGHTAYPHLTADPIVTLAQIISAAQTVVSRRINPMHPAVLSFGTLESGIAANVIPTSAAASGSIRSTDYQDRAEIARELNRIATLVADANHCSAQLEITSGEPLLTNDEALVHSVDPVLTQLGLNVREPMRSCGSDDFSFFSDAYPGIMMFLGTNNHGRAQSLHSPDFCPDDDSVHSVAQVLAVAYSVAAAALSTSVGTYVPAAISNF